MEKHLQEKVYTRKGCPLHYWVGGADNLPWVILLHGACVDHHSFDPVVPKFLERFRVLCWDARGHGDSQPMGDAFTVPLAVEDLEALMDVEGINDAVLIGHSNGTYVAQEMVFRRPERVRALVIADGTCITWEHSAFEKLIVDASPALMNLYPYETLKKASLPYASKNPDVQKYMFEAFSRLNKKDFIAIWTGVTRCLHAEPGYHIPRPFLLTHGDNDISGDIRKIGPKWAAREPLCTYEVIADAGHFAILDQPESFTRLVFDFLDRLKV